MTVYICKIDIIIVKYSMPLHFIVIKAHFILMGGQLMKMYLPYILIRTYLLYTIIF